MPATQILHQVERRAFSTSFNVHHGEQLSELMCLSLFQATNHNLLKPTFNVGASHHANPQYR